MFEKNWWEFFVCRHWIQHCTNVLQVVLRGWRGSLPRQGSPPLVCLPSILISWIFKGGLWMLGLPDYSPLNVVMLWLCSVAKNILPGFFFTFEVSTGLISHLSRLGTLCQRTDSARSFSPSNFALAPFLLWKLRLCLHTHLPWIQLPNVIFVDIWGKTGLTGPATVNR